MKKFIISGHETFHCRHFWLKKGYDYVNDGLKFSDKEAVVHLGVGQNMVHAIRYWMKAFNILDEDDELTEYARFVFSEDGVDPYLEQNNTLWLLHYLIISSNVATIYNLVFNGLLKERYEFTKEYMQSYIMNKSKEHGVILNTNTLLTDINVFFRNYTRPGKIKKSIEDEFSGILIELDLIKTLKKMDGSEKFRFEKQSRSGLPFEIVLFAILDKYPGEVSIPFYKLVNEDIGNIFLLNDAGMLRIIENFINYDRNIIYTDDAGVRELQFKSTINKWDVLKNYYEN